MFGVGVGIRVGGRTAVSSGGGFDPDAQAFFNRVTTAGGTLTTTEKNATNQLVLDMKSAGIWSSMKAIYPMVGASAAACAQNLKSSSFTGTFTSGWTFASTGATPNGTSAYMDSGLNANSNLTRSNHHISFYSRTQNSSGNYWNIGGEIAPAISNLGVYFNAVSNKVFLSGSYPTYAAYTNITNTLGLHIGAHTSSTSQKIYQNSSLLATNTISNTLSMPNLNYWVGAANNNGVVGLPAPHQCAFASIGDGLTDTQASNFYTAVQAFQTTLARQIAP
jgi:hypothetical protein